MQKRLNNLLSIWAPLILWCFFIFAFSSFPKTPDIGPTYWTNFIAKKISHLIEYGILGILAKRAFKKSWVSLIFLLLYAASDESHQSFIPGREGRVRDGIIDFIGGSFGIWIIKYIPLKIRKKLNI